VRRVAAPGQQVAGAFGQVNVIPGFSCPNLSLTRVFERPEQGYPAFVFIAFFDGDSKPVNMNVPTFVVSPRGTFRKDCVVSARRRNGPRWPRRQIRRRHRTLIKNFGASLVDLGRRFVRMLTVEAK